MKKFIITGAFPEPEWTQVPNKFFEMLPEMEASEALTTLVLIRETYGYHRPTCKMSIAKLAAAAGISEGSVKTGAEMAEARGTFRRTNPTGKTSAEWELVIGSTIDPSTIEGVVGQPLTLSGSTIDPQVGVKESIKKEKKGDIFDGMLFYDKQAKEQGMDKIEEIIIQLERGLRVNITRSNSNQQVAKRLLKDGRSVDTWLEWCRSDEWRMAHLYIYADLEKVWRDFPQAFDNNNMNPQALEIGL